MTKLTLSVDDDVIKTAKEWARGRGLSLSQMVSAFFISVIKSKQPPDEMPPILKKMAGILEKEQIPIKDYFDHLESKYL